MLKQCEKKVCQINGWCCTSDQINWFLDEIYQEQIVYNQFQIKHAKSMGGVEKVIKFVSKTDRFLTSLLTTLQVWTPEATISSYFAYETSNPTQGGHRTDNGQTDTLIASEV